MILLRIDVALARAMVPSGSGALQWKIALKKHMYVVCIWIGFPN